MRQVQAAGRHGRQDAPSIELFPDVSIGDAPIERTPRTSKGCIA